MGTVYARSTTVLAHLDTIDNGIAHVRDEVMPTLMAMDGYVGLSMLCDRGSGRCIVTSSWRTMELMRAGAERIRPIRTRAAEVLGGAAQVDEWEIAVFHRDHRSMPGACVRATWMRMGGASSDDALDTYRMGIMPYLQEFDGFCSASLMIDRESGYAVSSVTFDSRDAMELSRPQADLIRERGAMEAGVDVVEVGEYELALAHLRVPEMA